MREYLRPVPERYLRRLLDEKAQRKERFTELEACLDLVLEMDQTSWRKRKIRDYARRWGWSKSFVHRKLPSLYDKANEWVLFYAKEGTERGQEGDKKGTENGDFGPIYAREGTERGQRGDKKGTGTPYISARDKIRIKNTSSSSSSSGARKKIFWTDRDEELYGDAIRQILDRFDASGAASIAAAFQAVYSKRPNPLQRSRLRKLERQYGRAYLLAGLVIAGERGLPLSSIPGIVQVWRDDATCNNGNQPGAESETTGAANGRPNARRSRRSSNPNNQSRLFSYHEALAFWQKQGSPGVFADDPDQPQSNAMFTAVHVEGSEKPMWRLKTPKKR